AMSVTNDDGGSIDTLPRISNPSSTTYTHTHTHTLDLPLCAESIEKTYECGRLSDFDHQTRQLARDGLQLLRPHNHLGVVVPNEHETDLLHRAVALLLRR